MLATLAQLHYAMQNNSYNNVNNHATVPLFQFCIYYLQLNHYQQVCITGDWGLLLMRSCHPKYTDTEMLMLFGVFLLYLYVYGGCEQPPSLLRSVCIGLSIKLDVFISCLALAKHWAAHYHTLSTSTCGKKLLIKSSSYRYLVAI